MKTNIATSERLVRIIVGIGLIVAGVLFILESETLSSQVIAAAGVILGLDFAITGAIGFCPLYAKLGRDTINRRL